jgi:N-acetylglutamate synthase-like GNAT family acetyltransferase
MIHFKMANVQDVRELVKLVNSAYRGDYSKKGWTTEADLLDGQRTDTQSLEELIKTPENYVLMALNEHEKLLGCAHVRHEFPHILYFGMLTVEPQIQAQGLGKKILQQIETLARAQNMNQIRLTVLPQRRELIEFYERRGFCATGKSEAFPMHDPRYGRPKVANLELKEYVKVLS